MKTKNAFLAAIAFTFAVGSAFASMFANELVYVRAQLVQGGDAVCVQTNRQCDDTGSSICKISISTTSGTQTAATSGSTFVTYKAGCLTPLKNVNDNVATATPSQSIYSLTTEQP